MYSNDAEASQTTTDQLQQPDAASGDKDNIKGREVATREAQD